MLISSLLYFIGESVTTPWPPYPPFPHPTLPNILIPKAQSIVVTSLRDSHLPTPTQTVPQFPVIIEVYLFRLHEHVPTHGLKAGLNGPFTPTDHCYITLLVGVPHFN